jgi:hypothetical protein
MTVLFKYHSRFFKTSLNWMVVFFAIPSSVSEGGHASASPFVSVSACFFPLPPRPDAAAYPAEAPHHHDKNVAVSNPRSPPVLDALLARTCPTT